MKHSFKPLSLRQDPDSVYDVVIIGAGIGGLTTANLLAQGGMKVLLLEQHYVVGGYCSSFERKGYTFDAGSHFYPLLGDKTSITGKVISGIGVQNPWIKMDPVDQFHLPDGSCFSVPADYESYIAKLKAEFPESSVQLDEFFKMVRDAYFYGLLEYFRGKHSAQIEKYIHLSLQEMLDRCFDDKRLKLVLTADCAHWGAPPSRTSFVFDSMLRLSYFQGNYYPKGSSQVFADELALRFQEAGGTIVLRAMVEQIDVENGHAKGVTFTCGPLGKRRRVTVRSPIVVSNADMLQTFQKLLPSAGQDLAQLQKMQAMRKTYPCYLMHIGIRGMSSDALERAQGYYWRDYDTERVGEDALTFKLFVPTLFDPEVAPPDCHVMLVQKVVAVDYRSVTDWAAQKMAVEQRLKASLNKVLPEVLGKAEVCLTASALTSHRYTLNAEGAMLGWEMSPEQIGQGRPELDCSIENLYFTGHWTRPGGGITPVIMSAVQVAESILKKQLVSAGNS